MAPVTSPPFSPGYARPAPEESSTGGSGPEGGDGEHVCVARGSDPEQRWHAPAENAGAHYSPRHNNHLVLVISWDTYSFLRLQLNAQQFKVLWKTGQSNTREEQKMVCLSTQRSVSSDWERQSTLNYIHCSH